MFVRWSEEDQLYVPAGGVCHGTSSVEAYAKLVEIVEDTVETAQVQGLPSPGTDPANARN